MEELWKEELAVEERTRMQVGNFRKSAYKRVWSQYKSCVRNRLLSSRHNVLAASLPNPLRDKRPHEDITIYPR
jgi:hypothetical protein